MSGARIRVFFAGEHDGKSREANEAAWKRLAGRKESALLARLRIGRGAFGDSPMVGDAVREVFRHRGFETDYGHTYKIDAPAACYLCDAVDALLDAGKVSGTATCRIFLHLFGLKEYVVKAVVETADPLTAQARLEERFAAMDGLYPWSVRKRFALSVDVVQPVDAAMAALESGVSVIEGAA